MDSYAVRKKIILIAFTAIFLWTGLYLAVERGHAGAHATDSNLIEATELAKLMYDSRNFTSIVADQWKNVVQPARNTVLNYTLSDSGANPGDSYDISNIMSSTTSVGSIIQVLAFGLVMINIWLTIIRESMRGEPTLEFWTKIFLVMGVSLFVVTNIGSILSGIDRIGTSIVDVFNTNIKANEQEGSLVSATGFNDPREPFAKAAVGMLVESGQLKEEAVEDETLISDILQYWEQTQTQESNSVMDMLSQLLEDAKTFVNGEGNTFKNSLMTTVRISLFHLLRIAFLCAIYGQIFMIAVQLALRSLLAPVAVAGITSDGMRSSGVRYLKRLLSLYLQFIIILIFSSVFTGIVQTVTSGVSGLGGENEVAKAVFSIYAIIACMGAMIAAVSQSGSLAIELLGD